jgi:hypothetical protein
MNVQVVCKKNVILDLVCESCKKADERSILNWYTSLQNIKSYLLRFFTIAHTGKTENRKFTI